MVLDPFVIDPPNHWRLFRIYYENRQWKARLQKIFDYQGWKWPISVELLRKKKLSTFLSKLRGKYQRLVRFNRRWAERIRKMKNASSPSLQGDRFVCVAISIPITHSFGSFPLRQTLAGSLTDLFEHRAYFQLEFEHAWRALLLVQQTITSLMI